MKVLYVAGTGRSGSTLIANLLGQLDGVFAAGELRYLWRRGLLDNRPCGCGKAFADCPVWTSITAELAADPETVAGRLRVTLRIRRMLRHRVPDPAVTALYAAIAAHRAGELIVDSSKLPTYARLLSVTPGVDLLVLHLVRDPRAAAFSWRRRRGLDGPDDDELMSRPPAAKAALLWLLWNAAARWWFRRAPYLRVRYEDVVADPAGQLRRIAAFAGVADADASLFPAPGRVLLQPTHTVAGNPSRHRTGPVLIEADDQWRTALSAPTFGLITLLTLPLLKRFGYPIGRG